MTSTQAIDQLREFIGTIYEPDDIVEVQLIHKPTGQVSQHWHAAADIPKYASDIQDYNDRGFDAYVGVNPRKEKGGSKNKDVLLARALFVDFDNGTTPFEATVRIEEANLPAPTMRSNSGHGVHAYWRLDEPLQDLREWTLRQKGLIKLLGSDKAIHDPRRVMRLPPFTNHHRGAPATCMIVECIPARQYQVDEFPQAEPVLTRASVQLNGKVSEREVANAISYLDRVAPSRAEPYGDWLGVGMSLHWTDPSETMLAVWDTWSKQSDKYADGVCGEKWATFDRNGSTTIATLHQMANEDDPPKQRPNVKPALHTPAPESSPASSQDLAAMPLTDTGNAERLVARHGADLRFSQALGWLCWDGRRWKRDDTGEAERRAKRTVRELYNEAVSLDDADKRGKLLAWAKSSESARYRHNLLDLAKSEAVVVVTPDQLDQDDYLLNVTNGTVNLRTGELQPHDRADLITKLAPVEYDPDATCTTFDQFLDETVCQRKDLSRYLQQTFGMYLTGNISEQILLIGIGTGSNGKNTLIDQMTAIWGDYASEAAPGLLVAQKHQQHPTEIADLLGKRLIIASETERNEHLRVQFVKRITGDARLKGRFMHKDFFEFRRTVKVILITNNKPVISERTHAIWRRLRLVPFDNVVADQDQDKALPEKLRAESSGILAWLVRGCLEWQKVGLVTPQAVLVATDEYQTDSDWLERFVEQCLTFDPEQWTASARLTDVLTNWCREVGAQADIPGMHERLRQEGCEPKKNERRRGWQGVGVSTIDEVRTT